MPWDVESALNDSTTLLGEGAFGKVIKVYDTTMEKFIALKIIKIVNRKEEQQRIERAIEEFAMNYDLQSIKLTTFDNVKIYKPIRTFQNEEKEKFILIPMELGEFSLSEYNLISNKQLP